MQVWIKKIASILVSAALLFWILQKTSWEAILEQVAASDPVWALLAILLGVGQVVIASRRWQCVLHFDAVINYWMSFRLTLLSCTLNLVLPARAGELARALPLRGREKVFRSAVLMVIYERSIDLVMMLTVMALALIVSLNTSLLSIFMLFMTIASWVVLGLLTRITPIQGLSVITHFWQSYFTFHQQRKPFFNTIVWDSVIMWGMTLVQSWAIFKMVGQSVPLLVVFSFIPMAIFAGLFPLTFSGVGTRDWAMLELFGGLMSADTVLAVAFLFFVIRFLIPGIVGSIFLPLAFKPVSAPIDHRD